MQVLIRTLIPVGMFPSVPRIPVTICLLYGWQEHLSILSEHLGWVLRNFFGLEHRTSNKRHNHVIGQEG